MQKKCPLPEWLGARGLLVALTTYDHETGKVSESAARLGLMQY